MLRQYFPDASKFLNMTMAVGRVTRKEVNKRAEVSVNRHRMNEYVCIHFPEKNSLEVYDPDDQCDVGDIVLIRKLPELRKHVETHKIERIIHKVGEIIDPISGLRVDGDKYILDEPLDAKVRNELKLEVSKRETNPKYAFEMDLNAYKWESRNLKKKKIT